MKTRQETKDRLAEIGDDIERISETCRNTGHSAAADYIEFRPSLAMARAEVLADAANRLLRLSECMKIALDSAPTEE